MQVPFKDKKKYLKDELKKLEGFEMGWVMKEYDDEEHGNSVSLYGLDKGQAFGIDSKGTRATVALQSCYVVEYMFVGWTPIPDSQTIGTFSKYGSVAKKNFKKVKRLMDAFVKAMEAPEKKKVRKAYNIKWDTDGATLKECGLPRSVVIPDDVADDEVGDWLSDTYGFCHDGYMTNFDE